MAVSRFVAGVVACVLATAFGAPLGRATVFGTKFPIYRRLALDAATQTRLDGLYRANRDFAGMIDEFYAIFSPDYERALVECDAALTNDVRLATARHLLSIYSYHERSAPVPPWLVKHFSKLQQIACCLPDQATRVRIERILRDWVDELERGPTSVNLHLHFGSANRIRPLYEFAMDLRREARPVWAFSDFYPSR